METNGEDVVRGDAVAIWRYSPDSEARDTGMRRRDDYAIGKESVGGEREVERERSERGRGSGGVVITVPCIQMVSRTHTNHNEQHPRARPIPLSNATGSIHRRCTVRKRVCVCACAYASGAASSRTSNREMVICNLADKLPSVDWKIRRTSLEILLAANWLHDIEKTPGPRLSSALS